jgi:peptidylprolyl isomerase/peptidyl-prolyl cis-trans isomerase B (cyclophilin B)
MKKLLATLIAGLTMTATAHAADLPASNKVEIITSKGPVVVELFPDVAPKHVEAFKTLVQKGFYNGLKFHRVVPGFVAQTGDPTGTGTGGPGYTLKAEFNNKPHKRGALGMARSASPDSAGSQFYFVLEDAPHLDGNYTVFGQVISGMENIDKIKVGDTMETLKIVE